MKRFWIGNHKVSYGHDQQCGLGIVLMWMTQGGKRLCYSIDFTLLWWTVVIQIAESGDA